MNIESLLSKPERQSPFAILFILLRLGRNLIRYGWPILLVFFFNNKPNSPWTPMYSIFLGFAVVSAIGSILAYFRFYFYLEEEELIIERGLLQHTRINIPFDKIQTVNFRQNPLHRALGLVQLEIDTAGSAESEIAIQALNKDLAIALRNYLLANRTLEDHAATSEDGEASTATQTREELLLHLDPGDLMRIGISQNHLRTAGIILAFVLGVAENLQDFIGIQVYDEIGKSVVGLQAADLLIVLLMGGVVLLIAFFGSLIFTIIRHYNLRLWQTANGFKLEAGLFEQREKNMQLNRVQFVRWQQNLLQRQFGLFQLSLHQTTLKGDGTQQSMSVPGAFQPQIERVRATYFPAYQQPDTRSYGISPLVIRRRFLLLGVLPAVFVWSFRFYQWPGLIPLTILWWAFIYWTSRRYHRNWLYQLHPRGIQTQSGIFGQKYSFLKWPHVQYVQIRRNWYQRRKGLATLYFQTAAGRVRVPYIPLTQATAIRDYVLYYLERYNEPWM